MKPAAGYLPLAYSSPEPVQTPGTVAVLIPHSIFIGLRLALARGDLTLAGRWQQPCSKAECNHEDCGSKEISFDWSNKRRDGLLVGARVYHYPIEGSAQIWSERYDPQQLSLLRQYSLETEAMPDSVRILDR